MNSGPRRSRPSRLLSISVLAAGAAGSVAFAVPPSVRAQPRAADVLLSQGKRVIVSSSESAEFGGPKALDGNSSTRWASKEASDPEWIRVDLIDRAAIHRVKLSWEAAYAKKYRIEISDNGWQWTTVRTITNGDGNIDDLTGFSERARYLRVVGTERGTSYGYSLWELQVYGVPDSVGDTESPSAPTALNFGGVTSTGIELSWNASTDNINVSGYDVLRNGAVVATTQTSPYTDSGLTSATSYTYTVRARDAAGNLSAPSSALPVSTRTGADAHPFVLAGAGDIADQCKVTDLNCIHPKTAALVAAIAPPAVITMGDNQYDDAHLSDFQNYFDKTWGKFKSIMRPVPGNHESYDDTAFAGYKSYFGSIATPKGKMYYSWDMGNWHFVALDSNDFVPNDLADVAADPPQLAWLKTDLAATRKPCIAAYFHHPRFSSGDHGDNPGTAALWSTLVDNKVDLVLNGHDHHYERFLPQDAAGQASSQGPVEIIVGSGGITLYEIKPAHATTAKLVSDFGVIKLHLTDSTFATQLIGLDGVVLDSSPTYTCH
ncbi:discoidin domain-containing protein [Pendulispora rubella]|uniref:Discoidin domain-containing protein n=1 Tax=Pendulispora rubella TaxID=2741070 RepID=A0ABZ2L8E2_9BACT